VSPLFVGTLAIALVLSVLACRRSEGRLAVVLLVGLTLMLLATPSWYLHYASLTAAPAAVTVGVGVGELMHFLATKRRSARLAIAVLLAVAVIFLSAPLTRLTLGERFPGPALAASVANTSGCVTSDDPTTLVEMNVLTRNLERGCTLSVDLAGAVYDRPSTTGSIGRVHNLAWQKLVLTYLSSGSVVILIRFSSAPGFSKATAATVRGWPVIKRIGPYLLRHPRTVPAG
jgi:alpha-1,2-mannosyltransferase